MQGDVDRAQAFVIANTIAEKVVDGSLTVDRLPTDKIIAMRDELVEEHISKVFLGKYEP